MRVTLWHDRQNFLVVDNNPLPNDPTVDIPNKILDRYNRIIRDWLDIQDELEQFNREQDRAEEYERLA